MTCLRSCSGYVLGDIRLSEYLSEREGFYRAWGGEMEGRDGSQGEG